MILATPGQRPGGLAATGLVRQVLARGCTAFLVIFPTILITGPVAQTAHAYSYVEAARLTLAGRTEASFGQSVAVSSDGNTALVGVGGPAAELFTRSGTTWTEAETLAPSQLVNSEETSANVALSANGDIAVIGGAGDRNSEGTVWIFSRSGTTWSQQAELTGEEEVGAGGFGYTVAVSEDGSTVLVGAPSDSSGIGKAWVFTRKDGSWSLSAILSGGEESGAGEFGDSIALSADGSTILIGGPVGPAPGAWSYVRSGNTWAYLGKLTGNSGADAFGASVALSSDGTTALIGQPEAHSFAGAVWAFSRSGSQWTQQGPPLTGEGESGAGRFGSSVALSASGDRAIVGGPEDDDFVGAVWPLYRTGTTWAQSGVKLLEGGEVPFLGASSYGGFGWALVLSASGDTALIGDPKNNGFTGDVTVFDEATGTPVSELPGSPSVSNGLPGSLSVPNVPHVTTSHAPPLLTVPSFKVGIRAVAAHGTANELQVEEVVVLGTVKGEQVRVSCRWCQGQSQLGTLVAKGRKTVFKPRALLLPRRATLVVTVTRRHMYGRVNSYARYRVLRARHSSPILTWGYKRYACLAADGAREVACPS
jgi:FG-GAP repeat